VRALLFGLASLHQYIYPFTNQSINQSNHIRSFESLAALGERVLGFADRLVEGGDSSPTAMTEEGIVAMATQQEAGGGGMRFVGLVSLMDPPRCVRVCVCMRAGKSLHCIHTNRLMI
jgi:hypothetical protein